MYRFRAFKAATSYDICQKYIEGHVNVLKDYGVTNITTNSADWVHWDCIYGIVAEKEDGTIVGGIRIQISDGIQVVVLGALRGLQDVKVPMYITFVAYWVIGFPISFYLGKFTGLKAVGVWIGLLAGLTSAALFLYIRFARLTRKLVLEHHEK